MYVGTSSSIVTTSNMYAQHTTQLQEASLALTLPYFELQQKLVEAVYKDRIVHPGGFRQVWKGSWEIGICRPAWQCPELLGDGGVNR